MGGSFVALVALSSPPEQEQRTALRKSLRLRTSTARGKQQIHTSTVMQLCMEDAWRENPPRLWVPTPTGRRGASQTAAAFERELKAQLHPQRRAAPAGGCVSHAAFPLSGEEKRPWQVFKWRGLCVYAQLQRFFFFCECVCGCVYERSSWAERLSVLIHGWEWSTMSVLTKSPV